MTIVLTKIQTANSILPFNFCKRAFTITHIVVTQCVCFVDQHDLADRLFPCFGGKTPVPCNRINLKTGRPSFIDISTAESGTIQLEFRDLSRSKGMPKYEVHVHWRTTLVHQEAAPVGDT